MAKRIIRHTIKAIAVVAGLVFWLVPPTKGFNELLVFIGSMVVLLICLVLWLLLFGDERTGWWPEKPER